MCLRFVVRLWGAGAAGSVEEGIPLKVGRLGLFSSFATRLIGGVGAFCEGCLSSRLVVVSLYAPVSCATRDGEGGCSLAAEGGATRAICVFSV